MLERKLKSSCGNGLGVEESLSRWLAAPALAHEPAGAAIACVG